MLLVLVAATYGAKMEIFQSLDPHVLIVAPVLSYVCGLLLFLRSTGVSAKRLVLSALIWLAPGYQLLGFTLVGSACGFQSAGC